MWPIFAESAGNKQIPTIISSAADLVIEVLSPTNTVAEINEKEKLRLENGAGEFWGGGLLSPPGEGCHSGRHHHRT